MKATQECKDIFIRLFLKHLDISDLGDIEENFGLIKVDIET